jgi:hypothetical protein
MLDPSIASSSVVVPIRRKRSETDDDADDDDEIPWNEVTLSDSWWDAFHTRQRWEAIDPEQARELKKQRGRKRPNRKSAQILLFRRKDKPEK